ncbi:Protein of unknown function [Acetitomaculum ruminis DSM 5522]|uniref:DUF1292 domain-containing protein n=1 Tax=Acetitomaculum ruminis DSM 5522 TaxID=1120918 RepID=A0A1I0ZI40_9FIRM|nr:DUF1292 domain-containing protein [Acetitomaculum ruminis]SFB24796.1 Protein of unknown function [Acetitomaculum ruminis DSM 5522]
MEKIKFKIEGSEEFDEFFVLASTVVAGCTYLLVTEDEEGDSDCYILLEKTSENMDEIAYEIVEDEVTLGSLSKIFEELIDDISIEQ